MPSSTPSRNLSSASLASSREALSTRNTSSSNVLSPELEEKKERIAAACLAHDLAGLIDHATSNAGLLDDSLRRAAWPILLGYRPNELTPSTSLPPHRDESQVALDVNRAFVYYPRGESERQLERRKEELSDVILEVLRRHPALCYFQGYHDIAQLFYLVLGAQDAVAATTRLSLLRIRDFMLPSLDPAISHLELLYPILKRADPALYKHLPQMQPFFALASTLTMFSHVIQEYEVITRLFDFFLARETVIPVYFFAVVILSRREEILSIDEEEQEILHVSLGKLPRPLDLELLISQTADLYKKHPPESLHDWAWWKISSYSVLKATKTPYDVTKQSSLDGEKYFRKQEVELRRKQAFAKAMKNIKTNAWAYRRPASALSLAIAVGVYAWWMARNGGVNTRYMNFGPVGDFLKRTMGRFV